MDHAAEKVTDSDSGRSRVSTIAQQRIPAERLTARSAARMRMFGTGGMATVRIPAAEVVHLFRPLRPGQIRGEPWLARALVKLSELDQ